MKYTMRDVVDILSAVESDAVFTGGMYTREFLQNVENMMRMTLEEKVELKQKLITETTEKYSLESLDLPEKIRLMLLANDINDCTKLCSYSSHELMKKRGIGIQAVQTIEEKLKEKGMYLSDHWREF